MVTFICSPPRLRLRGRGRCTSSVRCRTERPVCRVHAHAGVKEIADVLKRDLPLQYSDPFSMKWDMYAPNISFDDPVTKISGKLMYKGMIYSIAVLARVLFKTAQFRLDECVVEGDSKVRSVFWTGGETRWGSDFVISGVDWFWCDDGKIVRHQSTWDQRPEAVLRSFTGK